jgi:hypothetical protein
MSFGSSVTIVSDYRPGGHGSIPGKGKVFSFSLCVQISSEAHTACTVGTGVFSSGCRARSGRDADHLTSALDGGI